MALYGLYRMMKNPIWGIVMVFLVNPLEPFFPDLGVFTVGRIVGLLATLLWFIYLGRNREAKSRLNNSVLLKNQLFFIVPVMLSSLVWMFETDGDRAITSAFTFVLLGLLALMLENIVRTEKDLKLVTTAMTFASVFACIPALLYYLGVDVYTPFGADAPTDSTAETLRATTLGGNPNSLGIVARNGVFASILMITSIKNRKNRVYVWLFLLVCFAGMVLSGSRTNFLWYHSACWNCNGTWILSGS